MHYVFRQKFGTQKAEEEAAQGFQRTSGWFLKHKANSKTTIFTGGYRMST